MKGVWHIIGENPNKNALSVKIVPETTPDPEVKPEPTPAPVGRTCQDNGYPAGYEWSDDAQACVFVAPAGTSSTGRFAVVNTADK